jgi:hypothetical protein
MNYDFHTGHSTLHGRSVPDIATNRVYVVSFRVGEGRDI